MCHTCFLLIENNYTHYMVHYMVHHHGIHDGNLPSLDRIKPKLPEKFKDLT